MRVFDITGSAKLSEEPRLENFLVEENAWNEYLPEKLASNALGGTEVSESTHIQHQVQSVTQSRSGNKILGEKGTKRRSGVAFPLSFPTDEPCMHHTFLRSPNPTCPSIHLQKFSTTLKVETDAFLQIQVTNLGPPFPPSM